MAHTGTARWLTEKARLGISDLPANVGWLVSKALSEPVSSTLDDGRRASRAVAASLPFGPDDLEARIRNARSAIEAAREAEQRAVDEAQRAKDIADEAQAAAEAARERRAAAEGERDAEVEQRVAEAQKRADEMVAKERANAEERAGRRFENRNSPPRRNEPSKPAIVPKRGSRPRSISSPRHDVVRMTLFAQLRKQPSRRTERRRSWRATMLTTAMHD
jgi:hypothetical protein